MVEEQGVLLCPVCVMKEGGDYDAQREIVLNYMFMVDGPHEHVCPRCNTRRWLAVMKE